MHQGLPSCYRKSVLAGIASEEKNHIESVISSPVAPARSHSHSHINNKALLDHAKTINANARNDEHFHFTVDVQRVEGVPCEASSRTSDVIRRGVRYCVVQTDQPPSAEQTGHPPIFLSNVSKLQADTHTEKRDLWEFASDKTLLNSPADGMANFVRCTPSDTPYTFQDENGRMIESRTSGAAALDQLYLFVELVVTLRCDATSKVQRKGAVKSRERERERDGRKNDRSKKGDRDRDKENSFSDENNSTLYTLGRIFSGSGKDKDKDKSKRKDGESGSGSGSGSRSNSSRGRKGIRGAGSGGSERDDSVDRDRDRDRSESPSEREKDRSPIREHANAREDVVDDESPVAVVGREGMAEKWPTVEMSCGWVMVPIQSTLSASANGKPVTLTLDMFGGSPFGIVNIDKAEKRPGALQAARRMLFGNIKPRVTLQIRPLPKPFTPSELPQNHKNHQNQQDEMSMTMAPTNTVPRSLFDLLPTNIVLPSAAVLMVGVYRQLLQTQMAATINEDIRALPQSGHNARSDLMLSAFPEIVSDEACSRVCMYIWALECPPSKITANLHTLTSHDLVMGDTLKAFRAVVLRLWRARCR